MVDKARKTYDDMNRCYYCCYDCYTTRRLSSGSGRNG